MFVEMALRFSEDHQYNEWVTEFLKLSDAYKSRIGTHSEIYHLQSSQLHFEKLKKVLEK